MNPISHTHFSGRFLTQAVIDHPPALGLLLKEMRERAGLSQRALAHVIGSSDKQVGRYEIEFPASVPLRVFVRWVVACGHQLFVKYGTESLVKDTRSNKSASTAGRQRPIGLGA